MQVRTKRFAVRVFFLCEGFPVSQGARVVSNQILKSSSSVAANYRASGRAKSAADFINKLKIVEEEADETLFWLEYIKDIALLQNTVELDLLTIEANELVSIITKSLKTLNSKSSN